MRLTLRFMLAYMDEILEPEDAQVIGKKIEESEHATKLLHRIRDCTRRPRLGAPDVADRGSLDPNSVAEYLDNTLPADRVPDFEKVCLESDVHLAEVSACHQILALVLGEPAEVDPATRQKMYQLPETLAGEAKPSASTGGAAAAATAAPSSELADKPHRHRPEVPEYLRTDVGRPRSNSLPLLLAATVLIAAGVGYLVWKSQAQPPQVSQSDATTEQKKSPWDEEGKSSAGQGEKDANAEKQPAEPKAKSKDESALPETAKPEETAPAAAPKEATAQAAAAGSAALTPAVASPPVGSSATDAGTGQEGVNPVMPAATPPANAVASLPGLPAPAAQPAAAAPAGETPAVMPGGAAPAPAIPAAGPVLSLDNQAIPAPAEPAAGPLQRVARLTSAGGVLLRYMPAGSLWMRLPEQAELLAGDRCLSLPSYQSVVSWAGKARARIVDGTLIETEPDDPNGIPTLTIDYGRVILQPEGKGAGQVRLTIGDRSGVVQFSDETSALAIEAARLVISNADPETQPGPMNVDLYSTSGKVAWLEANREPVTLTSPCRLTLSNPPQPPSPVEAFPAWIAGDTVNLLEQQASDAVARELKPDKPVGVTLRELTEHRRREIRWLALRCLTMIGEFELLTSTLDDPEQKNQYLDYIDLLQSSVRRGPRTAAQVRTSMEYLHGAQGASLYEMLWRYPGRGSNQAMTPADAKQLLGYLENDSLAFRRVAIWNLSNATQGKTYNYKPEDPVAKRESAVRKWRDHFNRPAAAEPARQGDTPTVTP